MVDYYRYEGINRNCLAEPTCVFSVYNAANRQCTIRSTNHTCILKFPFLCVFTYAATAIRSVTIFGHGIMMSLLLVLRWCFCVLHMFFLLKLISHPYHKQNIIMASNGHDDFHCASILLFVLIIAKHCIAHLNTHLHAHRNTHVHTQLISQELKAYHLATSMNLNR